MAIFQHWEEDASTVVRCETSQDRRNQDIPFQTSGKLKILLTSCDRIQDNYSVFSSETEYGSVNRQHLRMAEEILMKEKLCYSTFL